MASMPSEMGDGELWNKFAATGDAELAAEMDRRLRAAAGFTYKIRVTELGFLVLFYQESSYTDVFSQEYNYLDTVASITHVTWFNPFLRAERLRFIPDDLVAVLADALKERGLIPM